MCVAIAVANSSLVRYKRWGTCAPRRTLRLPNCSIDLGHQLRFLARVVLVHDQHLLNIQLKLRITNTLKRFQTYQVHTI